VEFLVLTFPFGGRSAQYQNSIVCCQRVRVAFLVAPVAYGIFNVAVCGAGMSARIDNLARAVTEPPVALAGGETVAVALATDDRGIQTMYNVQLIMVEKYTN